MQDNALQIAAGGVDQIGRGAKGFARDAGETARDPHALGAEPLADLEGDAPIARSG